MCANFVFLHKIKLARFLLIYWSACEILEILRQSACKICDWFYVKTGLSNQSSTKLF